MRVDSKKEMTASSLRSHRVACSEKTDTTTPLSGSYSVMTGIILFFGGFYLIGFTNNYHKIEVKARIDNLELLGLKIVFKVKIPVIVIPAGDMFEYPIIHLTPHASGYPSNLI